ncbi:efflux RND transporter periplasmic adaptor subunit [Paraglaciecola sp. 25GB23A]|uniref:efflux RND transporter periplasmic adaptor subunit n=1 Tax=Paraglaciecola sp. 25GB23A TaxID=3156068 RepID=UPI0032AFC29E
MTTPSTTAPRIAKSAFWMIVVLSFAALVALMWVSGRGQVNTNLSATPSQVVDIMPISLTQQYLEKRVAVGQVEANQLSSLGFDRPGVLIQTLVDEGQSVLAGQLMATLDAQRLEINLQEINATLSRVEADLRLAKLSQKRVAELVAKNLESSQRLDEVLEATAVANAVVAEITARKASVEVELTKTRLYAPFAGMVVSRAIDIGTVVNAGQPILVLQQENNLQVRIALPAAEAQHFSVAQQTELLWAQQPIQAQVKSIAQQRNLSTRTIDVLFTIDSSAQILAGDLVTLERQIDIELPGAWVPRTALISGVRGLWSIFVVEQNEQGQAYLVSKLVEVNYVDDLKVYVSGALASDSQVVINGVHKLVPGQLVQTQSKPLSAQDENSGSVL